MREEVAGAERRAQTDTAYKIEDVEMKLGQVMARLKVFTSGVKGGAPDDSSDEDEDSKKGSDSDEEAIGVSA
eukprot:12019217-Heterocapsa_arctica.AAC.2